jgi:hypothetical protein
MGVNDQPKADVDEDMVTIILSQESDVEAYDLLEWMGEQCEKDKKEEEILSSQQEIDEIMYCLVNLVILNTCRASQKNLSVEYINNGSDPDDAVLILRRLWFDFL